MVRQLTFAIGVLFLVACAQAQTTAAQEIRDAIQSFEQALKDRDAAKIESLVGEDLVVFENGHRNEGWADFRDNHLIPEMKEPAPPSKSEFVTIKASDLLAWAYTKTDMKLTRKSGEHIEARLWSIYILEKRERDWKIVLLDWSFYVPNRGVK